MIYLYMNMVMAMVFSATFNNIWVILWRSVLWVEETGENHRQTLSHNVVLKTPRLNRIQLTTLVVICTDWTGSYKSNYHTITAMTTHLCMHKIRWCGKYWSVYRH